MSDIENPHRAAAVLTNGPAKPRRKTPLGFLILLVFNSVVLFYFGRAIAQDVFYRDFFFNRELPSGQVLNNTQAGFKIPTGMMKSASIDYAPSDAARSLMLLLNYDDFDGDYEMLRFSPLQSPAAFTVRRGKVTVVTWLPVPRAKDYRISLRRADRALVVAVDGREVYRLDEAPTVQTLDFLFYPSAWWPPFRTPFTALRHVEIEAADRITGQTHVWRTPAPWLRGIGVWVAPFALVFANVGLCWLVRPRRGGRLAWIARLLLLGWPFFCILFVTAHVFVFAVVMDPVKQVSPFAAYWRDHRFDRAAFVADPVLLGRNYDLGSQAIRIFALGESTTAGEPYGRGEYDWPTQLQKLIDGEHLFGDRTAEVYNLGRPGALLKYQIPPGSASFFQTTKPKVVIMHNLVNNYHYTQGVYYLVPQILGFWRGQSANDGAALQRYQFYLESAIKEILSSGALLIMIVPTMDQNYFAGNPMAAWQAAAIALAKKYQVVIVDQQAAINAENFPIVFYEFVHPNRIGYRLLAQAVFDALKANKDRVVATD